MRLALSLMPSARAASGAVLGLRAAIGTCTACLDGQEVNDVGEPTACVLCGAGKAGVGGTCEDCDAGTAPSLDLTACDLCTVGRFSQLVSHAMRVPTLWMRLGSLTVASHRMA